MISSRSCALSQVALPRRKSRLPASVAAGRSLTGVRKTSRERPPVLRAMRRVRDTKSSRAVPVSRSALPKSGTRGRSSSGTPEMSRPRSRYRMPLVCRSWKKSRESLRGDASVGIRLLSRGRSSGPSLGMVARASGVSGVSWMTRSRACSEATRERPSGPIPLARAASCAASSASSRAARPGSGSSTRVTRCGLSRNMVSIARSKTRSPRARRSLIAPSGASKQTRSRGSPSCSHVVRDRSMSESPRGKAPVLFSRRENSRELTAASTASAGAPASARVRRVDRMISSTRGALAGSMPLSPVEKAICLSSVSSPPPARSSPSPESIRACARAGRHADYEVLEQSPGTSAVSRVAGPVQDPVGR